MLSRTKPAVGPGSGNTVSSAKDSKKRRKLPKLEDFLQMRDFTGAFTLLEVLTREHFHLPDSVLFKILVMMALIILKNRFLEVIKTTFDPLMVREDFCTAPYINYTCIFPTQTLLIFGTGLV